jgi:hypothetical protein
MTENAKNDSETVAAESKPPRKAAKKRGQKKRGRKPKAKAGAKLEAKTGGSASGYPRQSVRKALKVPRAILDQNAGKPRTDFEAAGFCGVKWHGAFGVELSSAVKYGFVQRPGSGQVEVSDLAKKVLRPQHPSDEVDGLREAIQKAPVLGDVYKHYRGENTRASSRRRWTV